MEGISKFVKLKPEAIITNTFQLIDTDGNDYTTLDEFISMVLNYPLELLESSLPYNFVYSRKIGEPTFMSSIQKKPEKKLESLFKKNSSRVTLEAKRHFSLCEETIPPETQKQLEALAGERRKRNAPTTINTRIKDWAISEFKKNSSNGKMTLKDYHPWAKNHYDFFKNFKLFFRTNWWLEFEDSTTRERRLSYNKLQTQFKSSGTYGLSQDSMEEVRMAIFDNLLMIFSPENFEMPIRLSILKELETDCVDRDRRIHLSHSSKCYASYFLIFNDENSYRQWKLLIQTCSKRSIRLSYKITKKLGRGKFSTVFLAKSISDSRMQYAVKKIDKATLNEDEKEVLA